MRDITEAIKERRSAITRLQAELAVLEKAQALLDGAAVDQPLHVNVSLGGSAKMRFTASKKRAHPLKGSFNPKSGVGHTVAVLREAAVPLHIDDIVERVGKRGYKTKKSSLGSTVAKMAKLGKIFYRAPQPNTFGLLEWQQAKVPEREEK